MSRRLQIIRMLTWLLLMQIVVSVSGCAIDYFDPKTGVEQIWGIGHMAMKPGSPNEGVRAIGYRTDTIGVSIGKTKEESHFALGWQSYQRLEVVDENTQLCMAGPSGSLYNVRVGASFPPDLRDCEQKAEHK